MGEIAVNGNATSIIDIFLEDLSGETAAEDKEILNDQPLVYDDVLRSRSTSSAD